MTESSALRPKSFSEYWPYYVSEHTDRRLRTLHNRALCLSIIVAAFVFGSVWADDSFFEALIIAAFTLFALGYGLVFASHWAVEGKAPTVNPAAQDDKMQLLKELLWSIGADYRMLWLTINERMEEELKAHNAA